ncbi:MAG: alginate lyase family protein [Pseudomonadota bacterium]|nr:alginate lyase family protein [Pseudomonadota bacterium]
MRFKLYQAVAGVVLMYFVSASYAQTSSAQSILLSRAELENIKSVLSENSTFGRMLIALQRDADGYIDAPPPTVTGNSGGNRRHDYYTERPYCGWFNFWGLWGDSCRDGEINPDADRSDYLQAQRMSRETVVLALSYLLLGEKKYGLAAARNVKNWTLNPDTYLKPQFTNLQSQIELCITQIGTIYAISLLWDTEMFSPVERSAIIKWVSAWGKSIETWRGKNNFEDWRIAMRLAIYSFTENTVMRETAVKDFKRRLSQIVNDQGALVRELNRTNSLHYSLFALNAMTQSAEIVRHSGIDLYHEVNERGVSMQTIFDYYYPYARKGGVVDWPFQQKKEIVASDVAIYELAYSRYRDPKYKVLIEEWGRPLIEIRTFQYISLSHGSPD